jgi:RNA polymerase sigma factor (sigma-70 family)
MTEGKSYLPWPGADDRIVVEEMLRDRSSGQWYECYVFVRKLVHVHAKNISNDHWDDIVQDAMIRLDKSLAIFQYHCAFRTWIFGIVRSCIIDYYRKSSRAVPHMVPLGDLYDNTEPEDDPHDDSEHEGDAFTANATRTVEDACITHDELDKALLALQEYVSLHANPIRNGQILDMVLFEGRSLEEVAKAVGCSAPVVGYVVRSAQRYVRERLRYQQ